MNPLHRAAERLHAGHWRVARTAARWPRQRPLAAAGAAVAGVVVTPGLWRALADQPKLIAALPAAWLWAAWRTPTAPTCDDRGERGETESGGVVRKTDKTTTRIDTTQGVAYATDDPTQPGYTRIDWETPWTTKAPGAAYEQP